MTTKTDLLKAIRANCLECSGGRRSEIERCHLTECSLWPYRLGRDPTPSRTRSVQNLAPVGRVLGGKGHSVSGVQS